jgi:GH35 family endo-1,4-beta-xylanase
MTRRLRRIALVLSLAATASLGATTSSSQAAPGMELALQDDGALVTQSYLKHDKAFPLLQELRVRWIRVNIGWAAVVGSKTANAKKKPGTVKYNFTEYDALINAARANGMQLEVGLTGNAPRWATGDKKKVSPYKPNPKLFREFVNAAVTHFGSNVTRYSIWNEPNHTGWLAPLKSQPALYRALYTQGYSAIKAVQPNAQVLIGETAPYASRRGVAMPPLEFIRKFANRGRLVADGFAHHPYDFNHAPTYKFPGKDNVTLSGLDKLVKLLDSLAKSNRLETASGNALDIWLTEFGYLRSGKQKQSEKNRAKYLKIGYDMALKHPRVRQMLHFLLAQPAKRYRFFDTSLVSQSGAKTPAFNALAEWAAANAGNVNAGR